MKLLLILLPLVFVYTFILTAVNSFYISDSTKDSLEKSMSETVQITAEHIDESISNNKKLTMLLANRVNALYESEIRTPYDELDVVTFAKKIADMGVEYGFLHMMVAGPDGKTITTVHTDLADKQADYYTAIIDHNQTSYVSDVTMDLGSFKGTYVLNYSAPIKDASGNTYGVLICKADAAELSALVKKISVGDSGSTFIMDNKGQCIAHSNPEMLFSGEVYLKYKDMPEERRKAHELCQKYNSIPESDEETREAILRELMPEHGEGVYLQGPIQFDFGSHIKMGRRSYANFNFCVLDENKVTIGDNVFIGPNCSILTPIHPLCYEDRNIFHDDKTDMNINIEYSAPVVIEDNCWLGGSVTVLPGVTIGEGCVIGAGAVVTKNIPAHSLAFGNPCRVVRSITEEDRLANHPERFAE